MNIDEKKTIDPSTKYVGTALKMSVKSSSLQRIKRYPKVLEKIQFFSNLAFFINIAIFEIT